MLVGKIHNLWEAVRRQLFTVTSVAVMSVKHMQENTVEMPYIATEPEKF